MNYVKFSTNLPKTITFAEYNKGKEVEGKFGKQYYWGKLQENGQETSLYATERLNEILEQIQPAGRTLEITKYEDGNIKRWKIYEAGIDITPTGKATPKSEATGDLGKRIEALEKRVFILEASPLLKGNQKVEEAQEVNFDDIPY